MPLPSTRLFSLATLPAPPGQQAGARHWLLWPGVQIGLILLIGLALYLPTFNAPFILDDYRCIRENPAIRSFEYFFDFNKVRALNIENDIKNNFALRPVAYLTFAFNYYFGGLQEFGYHLVNTCIHLLNAVMVYLLTSLTLRQSTLRPINAGTVCAVDLVPLLVALLFVAHPLQTQAVTHTNQRFTSLVTLFYFAALLLYIAARQTQKKIPAWFCYGAALLMTIAAMKTKENAFTLPAILFLYDLFFLDGRMRQRWLWLTPFFLTMAIIPGTLLWLVATDGVASPDWKIDQSINLVNSNAISPWDYLKTQFGVIATYLRLFILPIGQNLIPDYKLAESFFTLKTVASFSLLLFLLSGAIGLARRSFEGKGRPTDRLIAFGVLWFFITISLSSSIVPLDLMMLEYRVYLPSFGFFFPLVVMAADAADRRTIPYQSFLATGIVVVVLLSIATVARNYVYTDKVRILQDVITKSPDQLEARVDLAGTFLEQNRFNEAIAELTVLLQSYPNNSNMIANLGYAHSALGRSKEAITQYSKALAINPDSAYAHANLGFEYLKAGEVAEGETELRVALALDPHFGAPRYTLALLYEKQGRFDEATEQYRELLKSYPGNAEATARLIELGALDPP